MRFTLFAIGLSLLGSNFGGITASYAFEIEDQRLYQVTNPEQTLRVISTADIAAFAPLIQGFQVSYPRISVDYTVASSAEVMAAIYDEGARYDLVISSAMDLQTKLANDGFTQKYVSGETARLPNWAKWQDQLFAFTQEPAALVISDRAFEGLEIPANREQLIELLRANPDIFDGRIGTYDVRASGLGYLFATQDSRNTDSFWRLTEVMGRLNTQLYCCSGAMIDDVYRGRLALAYNVLGSYAENRLAREKGITIVPMQDYVTVMMRTALVPKNAENPQIAARMIDFLLAPSTQAILAQTTGLPPIFTTTPEAEKALRPIRLGPGLLVFLDRLKRQAFIRNWENSIQQK